MQMPYQWHMTQAVAASTVQQQQQRAKLFCRPKEGISNISTIEVIHPNISWFTTDSLWLSFYCIVDSN